MSLKLKNIRPTKVNVTKLNAANQRNLSTKVTKSNEAHFFIRNYSKMRSDQTGEFTYVAISGNQYLMLVCVVDANLILEAPFKLRLKSN